VRHLGQDGHAEDHNHENLGEMESHAYLVEGLYMSDEAGYVPISGTDRNTLQLGESYRELVALEAREAELSEAFRTADADELPDLMDDYEALRPQLEAAREDFEQKRDKIERAAGGAQSFKGFDGYQVYQER
jgi:hypothetical protein